MAITYNDYVTCQLDTTGEIAFYRFAGTSGERFMILVSASNNTGPCWALYNPTGTLAKQVCPWGAYVAADEVTLAETGTFTIRVFDNGHNNVWTYAIYLERMNPPISPTMISFGQKLTGKRIDPAPESDQYAFTGTAGDSIAIQMDASDNTGPVAGVYKPNGDLLQQVAPWGGYVARMELVLPATGTYLIRASDNGRNTTFDYSLFLQCLGACTGVSVAIPTNELTLTGCTTCNVGGTFSAKLTTSNVPGKTTELKLGFYFPDNTQHAAGEPHLELPPGFTFDGEFLRLPITASHPKGNYRVCARILEIAAGDILAASCQSFVVQ